MYASATDFWGIDDELKPFMRMTAPEEWRTLSVGRVEPGQPLFRSRLLSAPVWEHERTTEPTSPGSCRLTDRGTFDARTILHRAVLRVTVPRLFVHRHQRPRRRYGGAGSPES